jgi:hypothetical protein
MKYFFILFLASQMLLFSEMKIEFLTTDFYGSTIFNNNIYCYGKYGVVLISSDTGKNWNRINLDIKDNIIGNLNYKGEFYLYSTSSIYKLNNEHKFIKQGFKKDWTHLFNILLVNDTMLFFTDLGIINSTDFSNFNKISTFSNKCNSYYLTNNNNLIMVDSMNVHTYDYQSGKIESENIFQKTKSRISFSDWGNNLIYLTLDSGIYTYNLLTKEYKLYTNRVNGFFKTRNNYLLNPMYLPSMFLIKTNFPEFRINSHNQFFVNNVKDTIVETKGKDKNNSYIIEPGEFRNYFIANNIHILTGTKNTIYISLDSGANWELINHYGYLLSEREGYRNTKRIILNTGQNLINSSDNGITWKPLSVNSQKVPFNDFSLGINSKGNVLINQTTYSSKYASTILFNNNFDIIDTAINTENFYEQTYIKNIPSLNDTFIVAAKRGFKNHNVVDFYIFKNSTISTRSSVVIDSSTCSLFFEKDKEIFALCPENKEYKNSTYGLVPTKYNNILLKIDFSNNKVENFDTLNYPYYSKFSDGNLFHYDNTLGTFYIYNFINKKTDSLLLRKSYIGDLTIRGMKTNNNLFLFLDSTIYYYDKIKNEVISQVNLNRIIPDWDYGFDNQLSFVNFSKFNFMSVSEDSSVIASLSIQNKKLDNLGIISIPSFDDYLIRITPSKATSIESPQIEENAYLYTYPPRPNPATQSVSAEVYWNSAYNLLESNISVYDIYGSKYNSNITFTSKEPFRAIINADCSNLATGIYFIRISVNGEHKIIPFTVVK